MNKCLKFAEALFKAPLRSLLLAAGIMLAGGNAVAQTVVNDPDNPTVVAKVAEPAKAQQAERSDVAVTAGWVFADHSSINMCVDLLGKYYFVGVGISDFDYDDKTYFRVSAGLHLRGYLGDAVWVEGLAGLGYNSELFMRLEPRIGVNIMSGMGLYASYGWNKDLTGPASKTDFGKCGAFSIGISFSF